MTNEELLWPAKRLDLKGVNIYYGAFHAVADVELSVLPRSVTVFIGPSGCGKSTVLRTLNRMHEVIPGARGGGFRSAPDGADVRARRGSCECPQDYRHGVSASESVPRHVDSRQRGGRAEASGCA